MTNLQKNFMAIFCALGVIAGLVLSDSFDDKAYMNLAMGFVAPIFSLLLMPRNNASAFIRNSAYFIMTLVFFGSAARASVASLQVSGDFVPFILVATLTWAAMSCIMVAGAITATLRIKLPILGHRTFKV